MTMPMSEYPSEQRKAIYAAMDKEKKKANYRAYKKKKKSQSKTGSLNATIGGAGAGGGG